MPAAKKWSGNARKEEKANRSIYMKPAELEKTKKEICGMKLITVPVVIERFKVTGCIARRLIRLLAEEKRIEPVIKSGRQLIYTKVTVAK
eukprot:gnl/Chilomastix_caulleri/208.p2 GENE.gnl/Chilomastix_caulleri/208~~gnl/Chilomastix_caulleri/208.p2  ORF type:complete len:90 (+),score=27.36 gnl/Chilomastix_caulleri/208:64-333(+)